MENLPIPPRDPDSLPDPKFVEILKSALEFLWDGNEYSERREKEKFICTAIETTEGDRHDRNCLKGIIRKRINWGFSYRLWLWDTYEIDNISSVKIQAGRKRWLEDLIEEFSPKEETK